jgi:CRISPR-associated protein Csx14
MGESAIVVDLLNPGQVFACLGLMEATEVLAGPCTGEFDVAAPSTEGTFRFRTPVAAAPIDVVLDFLQRADVRAIAPASSSLAAKEPGVITERRSVEFPSREPATPSALPVVLTDGATEIPVEHWADESRDNVKFWAGAGGYSGAALTRDLLVAIRGLSRETRQSASERPFDVESPMTSSFRLDWRRDYIPMDVGFSPNNHQTFEMVGYPFVELLAAVGLQHARPTRVTARDKLHYRYGAWTVELPTMFARAALGGHDLGFPYRRFGMRLGWPGQEGQARCIVDAREESTNDRIH